MGGFKSKSQQEANFIKGFDMSKFSLLLGLPVALITASLTLPDGYGSVPKTIAVTPEADMGIRAFLSSHETAEIQADYNNLSKSLVLQMPEIFKSLEALGLRSISANIRAHSRASADPQ